MLLIRRCRCGVTWKHDVPEPTARALAAIWRQYHTGDGHGPPERIEGRGAKGEGRKEAGARD